MYNLLITFSTNLIWKAKNVKFPWVNSFSVYTSISFACLMVIWEIEHFLKIKSYCSLQSVYRKHFQCGYLFPPRISVNGAQVDNTGEYCNIFILFFNFHLVWLVDIEQELNNKMLQRSTHFSITGNLLCCPSNFVHQRQTARQLSGTWRMDNT